MTRFADLLRALSKHGVEYVLMGGVAAAAHGSARATQELDIVYSRHDENLDGLVSALEPLHPYLRGAPPGLPFRLDKPTLKAGLNFTLTADLGWIDLLGEIAGAGQIKMFRSARSRLRFLESAATSWISRDSDSSKKSRRKTKGC